MNKMYKLYVIVLDEGGRRNSVILVDGTYKKVGTLEEVKARKAKLKRIFPDRSRWKYEIGEVKYE